MQFRGWVVLLIAVNVVVVVAMVSAAYGQEKKMVGALEAVPKVRSIEQVYETVALASAVAFVTAVSIVGSAIAVGRIGSAALGAAAEKPELLTRAILYVALAEGLAVLGFAVAMMLMAKMT